MYDDSQEKLASKPLRFIIFAVLGIIVLSLSIWALSSVIGVKIPFTIRKGQELTNLGEQTINQTQISLEKSVIIVDSPQLYTNQLKITSIGDKLLLSVKSGPCVTLENGQRTEELSVVGMRSVNILIKADTCPVRSQTVIVKVFTVQKNGEKKLLKTLSFKVYVTLSAYLNILPQDGAVVKGFYSAPVSPDFLSKLKQYVFESHDLTAILNNIVFFAQSNNFNNIYIVVKIQSKYRSNTITENFQTLFYTIDSYSSIDSALLCEQGLEEGTFYIVAPLNRGQWIILVPSALRAGAWDFNVTFYVLISDFESDYNTLLEHFKSNSYTLMFTSQQLSSLNIDSYSFDSYLRKKAVVYDTYHYTYISLPQLSFPYLSTLGLFLPYWIDFSGSLLHMLEQGKNIHMLAFFDSNNYFTPLPPISFLHSQNQKVYNMQWAYNDYVKFGQIRPLFSVWGRGSVPITVREQNRTVNVEMGLGFTELMYQQENTFVVYRKLDISPYSPNLMFNQYNNIFTRIKESLANFRGNEYSPDYIPLALLTDNFELVLRGDSVRAVSVSDVQFYTCLADSPSQTPLKEFWFNRPLTAPHGWDCAPNTRYFLKTSVQKLDYDKFDRMSSVYRIQVSLLGRWFVTKLTVNDFINAVLKLKIECKFKKNVLSIRAEPSKLLEILFPFIYSPADRNKPSLDNFNLILSRPDCAKASGNFVVLVRYRLTIKTEHSEYTVYVYDYITYPLSYVKELHREEENYYIKQYHQTNQTNQINSNQTNLNLG